MGWSTRTTLDGGKYYVDLSTGHITTDLPEGASAAGGDGWCWIQDEAEGWLPAKKAGGDSVQIGGSGPAVPIGERRTLPLKRAELDRPVTDDLVMLDDINEGIICHTLRARHTAPGSGFCTRPRARRKN